LSGTRLAALTALAAATATLALAPSASAALGRVVALGDSMASGMGLGPAQPMINPACGRTLGSYPQLTRTRLSPSSFEDVTCNGGHTGVFSSTNPGLDIPENNHVTIPPQFNSLLGSEQAVIVGTGGNEAYFGEAAFACLGYQPDLSVWQVGGTNYRNNCKTTYGATGSGLIAKVANAESLVGPALDQIHVKSPNAKVFLVGVPRIATPDGAGCMPNPILTLDDAPVYAVWEDQLRLAMKRVVAARSSWARFVDVNEISGTTHTTCAAWGQKWINPWSVEPGLTYPGIALHNTPAGASAMANAIVDSFHAAGLDTGSQSANATDPVVTIGAPANNLVTKNASVTVSYSATDNVAIASCTRSSGSSVALSEGANAIVVDCQDHAGNHGSAQVTVTRDATPPSITNVAPADGTNTTASSVQLSYSAADNIGTPSCTPASGTTVNLNTGANTVVISCTDSAGNTATKPVTINRGSRPTVAIVAPVSGHSTTSASVNVAYTVNGGASIPAGTDCTVNGAASTSAGTNSVTLNEGANTITLICTNQFGTSTPASISVTGSPPSAVSIASPADGTNTTATSINVAYTVNGGNTIPDGTTCKVNNVASTTPQTNNAALVIGANTITVNCTGAFGSKSSSVTVNRGNPPVASITSPTEGTSTAASSINVSYKVDGAASLPAGTSCTVAGVASTSATTNNAALVIGANTIAVVCANQFGQGSPVSVAVTRGAPPVVAITSPASGLKTSAAQVNVAYTVGGNASIPAETTCKVNGANSASATTNPLVLAFGTNTASVSCTNGFGTSIPTSVNVERGNVPVVAIISPVDGTHTASAQTNVVYTVDGGSSIPAGTDCSVGGAASTSTATNSVSLSSGNNTIAVLCSNAYGSSLAAGVTVVRGPVPVVAITAPADNTNTTAENINVTYTVGGSGSIPAGTTCSVGGTPSVSTSTNQRALNLGANALAVSCSNAFGDSSPVSVNVNRGNAPAVEIVAPADGTLTSATWVNVAFKVDGDSSIPAGTTCKVGSTNTTNASANVFNLSLGANTITLTCTSAFGSGSQTVGVTRGNGPSVSVSSPANGLKTVGISTSINFTVNGLTSIPGGTTCFVNGQQTSSTTANNVGLALGTNAIAVKCVNGVGEDTQSVTVERGTAPSITITSPADNSNTVESFTNIAFSVSGSGTKNCFVNGEQATSPWNVPLYEGSNTFTLTCSSGFGADLRTITITRGLLPMIYIYADLHTDTPARIVNAVYSIAGYTEDDHFAIPAGTTCSVNGTASTNPNLNSVALTPGDNTVTVRCSNAFGDGSATVYVTYTPPGGGEPEEPTNPTGPIGPVDPTPEPTFSLKLTKVSPATIRATKSGRSSFAVGRKKGGGSFKVTLSEGSKVKLRLERVVAGRSSGSRCSTSLKKGRRCTLYRGATKWQTLKLAKGSSTIHVSGRSANKKLKSGSYRVVLGVDGRTQTWTGKAFKLKN
jgi:hypothetical protein